MAKLIYDDDLYKRIMAANTPKKAKQLAASIKLECDTWRELYLKEGVKLGKEQIQSQVKESLGITMLSLND